MEDFEDDVNEEFDTDVRNYTVPELIEAIGLSGTPSRQEVDRAVQQLVNQNARADATLAQFYMDAGAFLCRWPKDWMLKAQTAGLCLLEDPREEMLDLNQMLGE